MKISFLCSDAAHPVNAYLNEWIRINGGRHQIDLVRRKADLTGGDILFLISCSEIIRHTDRALYRACLVLHASDLPRGRGWSPHIWEIAQGAESITLSLLDAADEVDSGHIWKKLRIDIPKHAMWNEINDALFNAELELIDFAVDNIDVVEPMQQDMSSPPSYYRRRIPDDSRIDPNKSIAEQFDQIRVCDPARFPAFFDLHGHRFKLTLEKIDEK